VRACGRLFIIGRAVFYPYSRARVPVIVGLAAAVKQKLIPNATEGALSTARDGTIYNHLFTVYLDNLRPAMLKKVNGAYRGDKRYLPPPGIPFSHCLGFL